MTGLDSTFVVSVGWPVLVYAYDQALGRLDTVSMLLERWPWTWHIL